MQTTSCTRWSAKLASLFVENTHICILVRDMDLMLLLPTSCKNHFHGFLVAESGGQDYLASPESIINELMDECYT